MTEAQKKIGRNGRRKTNNSFLGVKTRENNSFIDNMNEYVSIQREVNTTENKELDGRRAAVCLQRCDARVHLKGQLFGTRSINGKREGLGSCEPTPWKNEASS